jgi:hypothetical protein
MHRDRRAGPEDARAVVRCGQAFEISLHAWRERFVRCIHAGELRVAAAVRRHGVVVENRTERWNRRARLIAVEVLSRDELRVLIVVELAHRRVFRRFTDRRLTRVLAESAEITGQANLIVERDLLVAKKHDPILRERGAQLFHLPARQRLRQIDASDHGPDVR